MTLNGRGSRLQNAVGLTEMLEPEAKTDNLNYGDGR